MVRIQPENIRSVGRLLFGDERASGPNMAAALGVKYMTLWAWLDRRGMPVHMAGKLATWMEQHAMKLVEQAAVLRRQIEVAEESEAEVAR